MDARKHDVMASICQAPFCPAPERVAHSHWMTHLPFAFWLVRELRPRMLIELGVYEGASFCAFCQQIAALHLTCEAYGVDTWQGDGNMGAYSSQVYEDLAAYVAKRYASFASLLVCSFDEAAGQFEDGCIDLLHLDGCHARDAILHDFETWLPKVSSRGVILVHDICARLPGYGGAAAWQEIRARFPAFAFTHGYGLGVVLPGNAPEENILRLTGLDPAERRECERVFHEQGKIYQTLFNLEQKRRSEAEDARNRARVAEEDRQQADAALRGHVAELGELLAREREAHNREKYELEQKLMQSENRARAYADSLSWKLTSPLRKLARMCRR